jgi:hypothetical protein
VRQGVPFRQAYRRISDEVRTGRFSPPTAGPDADAAGRLSPKMMNSLRAELEDLAARIDHVAAHGVGAESNLLPVSGKA